MKIHFFDIKPVLISQLTSANKEIRIAVSWLTDREIFHILLDKLKTGVRISLITRNDYLNNHPQALNWKQFIDLGGELRFCQPGKMLHYKFAVIDEQLALATSYNWTCFAGSNNRENIMIMKDPESVNQFIEEFDYLCTQFSLETNPQRIELNSINQKLHGFYELTLADDEKNQVI